MKNNMAIICLIIMIKCMSISLYVCALTLSYFYALVSSTPPEKAQRHVKTLHFNLSCPPHRNKAPKDPLKACNLTWFYHSYPETLLFVPEKIDPPWMSEILSNSTCKFDKRHLSLVKGHIRAKISVGFTPPNKAP